MVKWKQSQWQRLFSHMVALSASCCYAALFYRCVLLNAFKELFAAKYLSLHIFQAFCSLFTLLCQTVAVCSRSFVRSVCIWCLFLSHQFAFVCVCVFRPSPPFPLVLYHYSALTLSLLSNKYYVSFHFVHTQIHAL